MDEILRQLGDLFLGSIPTIVLFLLLYVSYSWLVHRPLERTLAERRSRTQGAMEKAAADVAAADARTAEYEQRLREAKTEIYKAQERRRQKSLEAREAALAEAREAAGKRIREAQGAITREATEARAHLDTQGEALAAEVVRTVLKSVQKAAPAAAGGRS